ncbi:MAG: tetratricopeptide repeat protein [Rivularia sp. (in: cyanobacteria)]
MNKNDVLEIYDNNYIKECEYTNQLKISVNKGINFLLKNQLNYGEFKTEVCNRYKDSSGKIIDEWIFDSSPFATALILYCLNFIEEDERVQEIRKQGLKFLMDEMEEGGLWRYWSSKNEKHGMIPPDLDDICSISHILKINNISFPDNTKTIVNNRNSEDIFHTWLLSIPGKKVLYSNDTWTINQEDDICCIVNSNVLLYLGEIKETEKIVEHLSQVILKGTETTSTPFYNHELSFYYMLSRAYYNGVLSLNTVKEAVVDKILNTQKSDGSFGNHLLTSLAICSLLNYDYYSPELSKAIIFLIKSQQFNGSWKRIPVYGGHADKAIYGSAELTTAFCIEALARYQLLKTKNEHKEMQEETGTVIVKSRKTQEINRIKKIFILLFKTIRLDNWWLYKITPLLAIGYGEIILMDIPPIQSILTVLSLLFSISSVAAYGHIVNDIFDIEVDTKAGKSNSIAQFSPWQQLLFCILFAVTGFVLPIVLNFGTWAVILLGINYLLPTIYSAPPLRLKEKGIWGVITDAGGAHLVPTLFVAATFLSFTPQSSRNILIFTGLAATHAFFVGLRGILLHQLWDRDKDEKSGTTTFVSQRQPETVRRWIAHFVFPVEIALLVSVAVILSLSEPWLIPFFVAYFAFTIAKLKATKTPLDPSPTVRKNIVPHDLYEVWLPLALAMLLSSGNPRYLGFVTLTLVLFLPSVKNRVIEVVNVFKTFLVADNSPPKIASETDVKPDAEQEPEDSNDDEIEVSKENVKNNIKNQIVTNVSPLTPEMQRQLESEGYVVLDNFLSEAELQELRDFDRAHPLPEDMASSDPAITIQTSDFSYRKKLSHKFKAITTPKLAKIIPDYRVLFCPWFRKKSKHDNNLINLHQDPYFTDESRYLSLGIWCPLNDVDFESSCLYAVKGSHTLNLQKRAFHTFTCLPYKQKELSYIRENYLTPIPLKAGQALLFDKRLFHGSPSNTSNIDRVAATCFILIPNDAPLYFCYRESQQADNIEIYEVPDEFYNRYILGDKPDGNGVKLIGTEDYTYDPITPEIIAEVLEPLHQETSTNNSLVTTQNQESLQYIQEQAQKDNEQLQAHLEEVKNQLQNTQAKLQTSQTELVQSQSELNTSKTQLAKHNSDLQYTHKQLSQSQFQLQQTQTKLTQSQSQLQTTETELVQLKTYLQQTQGEEGLINYYRSRIASNPDDIELYHQALTIKPDDGQTHLQLGNALVRQNRFDDAIVSYQTALQFHPENFEIYLELAKTFEKQNQYEQAINSYRQAIELNPDNALAYKSLGDILAENGQLSEATTSYRRALQLQNITKTKSSELYKWNILDIQSLDNGLDSIDLLHTDELDGILIKNVFSTKEIETVREHIKSLSSEFEQTIYGERLGLSIMEVKNDLNEYFQKASNFRLQLNKIFANEFERRIFNVFNHLHSLKNIKLLERENGEICIPAQIRIMHPGKGSLKAHIGNEVFVRHQVYDHLKQIKKDVDTLSYFIVIDKPEKGGELVLYDFLREQTTLSMKQHFYSCQLDNFLDNFRKQYISPDIGDMVIFNGGRIWHKVANFDGDKNRITVGGFLAYSQDNQTIYCIS